MLIYDLILTGDDATEDNAIHFAMDFVWSESECREEPMPRHSHHIYTTNGIAIYYDYAADYYWFADATGSVKHEQ